MTLYRMLTKKSLVVVGLNSGTSADGLDMAALRFGSSGKSETIRLLATRTGRFDSTLRQTILDFTDATMVSLDELVSLDNMLGIFFGRAAASFVKHLYRNGTVVDAIASHGQTIRHMPTATKIGKYRVHGTLQLGSPDQISALTGKPVVADFRQADVVLGGEGAPITVEAMRRLFTDKHESRLIVNIGGMANYFYFPKGSYPWRTRAADCGPGNVLCDILSGRLFGEKYDRGGRRAGSGSVSDKLLTVLLEHRFFKKKRRSTGREEFGPKLVDRILLSAKRFRINKEDIMATTAELTVASIISRIRPLVRGDRAIRKLYLTGGGSHNKFFVRRLQDGLPDIGVGTIKELGFDPDIVEAASFAVIGKAALCSQAMPTRFDGRRKQQLQPVLGRIVQPPQKK